MGRGKAKVRAASPDAAATSVINAQIGETAPPDRPYAPPVFPEGRDRKTGGAHRCKSIEEPLPGVGERAAAPEKARAVKHILRRNGRNEPLPAWDAVIVLVNDAFVQTRLSAGISNYRSRFASLHLGGGINGLVLRIGCAPPGQTRPVTDRPAPSLPPASRPKFRAKPLTARALRRLCRSCRRSRSL